MTESSPRPIGRFRVAATLAATIAVSALSLWLAYRLLHDYAKFSQYGTVLLLTPVIIILIFGGSYGYYVGYQRYRYGATAETRLLPFVRRLRILTFGLLALAPILLTLVCALVLRDSAETAVFAVLTVLIAPWGIVKIRRELGGRTRSPR